MADKTTSVSVQGLSRLRRDLRKAGEGLEDLKAANAAAAAIVAAAAEARAPRRTGRLAASVRGNRAASRASVSAGRASVPYAGPIHYGWPARHIEAQPFVIDAAQATESAWLPAYERDLDRVAHSLDGHRY